MAEELEDYDTDDDEHFWVMTLMTLFGSGTHSLTPGSAPHLSFSSVLLLYYTLHPQDAAALTNPNFKSVERTSIKDIKKVRVTRSTLVLRQRGLACSYQSDKRQLHSYQRMFTALTALLINLMAFFCPTAIVQ